MISPFALIIVMQPFAGHLLWADALLSVLHAVSTDLGQAGIMASAPLGWQKTPGTHQGCFVPVICKWRASGHTPGPSEQVGRVEEDVL